MKRLRMGRGLMVVTLAIVGTCAVAGRSGARPFDELILAFAVGTLAIACFAMRRQREAEAEVRTCRRAEQEPANLTNLAILARMGHAIRTPLNGIVGTTELLVHTPLTTAPRELVEIARASSDALSTVINDLLDFSQIQAGKVDLQHVAFDLRDCVGETLEALAVSAHQKFLELTYTSSDDVPGELYGDPARLRQVLVNLVGNAIEFTRAGGEVVVTIDAMASSDRETRIRCSVRDTGIGISPEQRARVFDVLEPGDGGTTPSFASTGLGLPISAQIVHLMGGEIGVESVVGQGSTFHFTAAFERQVRPSPAVSPSRPTALRGMRVLVVDDNLANRRILEMMLRGWGMEPTAMECGADALCALQEAAGSARPFRLVILDVQMPGLDGFEVAERIQDDPNLSRAPILMLTSDRRKEDRDRCRELGVAGYLVKPVRQSELLQAIWEILSASPATGRAADESDAQQLTSPRPLRVLLAEDNPLNQALMVRVLERTGHHVTVAANGKEALAKLSDARFDVVLMDIEMPEMDGLEAAAAIRRCERADDSPDTKHIPIVALTAHAMVDDPKRCLDADMDAYLSKPVNVSDLLQAIHTLAAAA